MQRCGRIGSQMDPAIHVVLEGYRDNPPRLPPLMCSGAVGPKYSCSNLALWLLNKMGEWGSGQAMGARGYRPPALSHWQTSTRAESRHSSYDTLF